MTRSDLRALAKKYAGSSQDMITDSQYNTFLSDAETIMVRASKYLDGSDTSQTTTAGTADYTLAANSLSLKYLKWGQYILDGQRDYISYEEYLVLTAQGITQGTSDRFAVFSGQIYLYPAPNAANILGQYFIKKPVPPALDTDSYTIPDELQKYLGFYAAAQAKIADQEDASLFLGLFRDEGIPALTAAKDKTVYRAEQIEYRDF